jgi:glc operon protein GlcG
MPRVSLGMLPLFLLVASLGSQPAMAQPSQGTPPPQSGGRGGALPATIDLATAKKIVAAAQAAATAANARVAIAVVDSNGDLVVLERMDGSGGRGVSSAQGKARAAIVFGKPTKEVADAAAAGTILSATLTPSGAGTGEVTIQQGGLPIMRDGKVVGGVGVGGSSPANDETFARAGVESIK